MASAGSLLPSAVVLANEAEGAHYSRLRVARTDELAQEALLAAYSTPGQYVLIEVPSVAGSGYFAMARAPGEVSDGLEFLVKRDGVIGLALARLGAGARIGMSDPIGAGFRLERAADSDVLLLAAGSGIGPIRAVLEALCRERDNYGWIRLYYGQSHAEHFAFEEWLASLGAHGVGLEKVVSSSRGCYVQDVADTDENFASPERLAVVLCGMPQMEGDARARCLGRGVEASRILTNQ